MSDERITVPSGVVLGPHQVFYTLADSLPPIGVPPAETELSNLIRKRRDKAARLRARAEALDAIADELSIALDRMKADPNRSSTLRGSIQFPMINLEEDT